MRIIFALTVALGVATPTLTSTTANSVGHQRIDDIAPQPRKPETRPVLALLSVGEIEGIVGKLDTSQLIPHRVAVPAKTEDPENAEEPAAQDPDDEDVAVTVPIEQVCETLATAASSHDLPIGFFARLIWQESKFDQWARSHAGAMGVAQFMPLTALEFGLHDPFDPLASIVASARFLRQLRDQFGNLGLAAAAYNAGGGRIRKWLNGQSGLPEETQNYVQTITGHPAKRWTVAKPLDVSFALPGRAPCDGVEGLSRSAGASSHDVKLTDLAVELLEQAAASRAKAGRARAARNKRHATRHAKGGRKVAVAKASGRKAPVRLASATVR